MKPVPATTVLRQLSPRKTIGTSFFTANRFNHLRDSSPANSVARSRSISQKRKNSDEVSYASKAKQSLSFSQSLSTCSSELEKAEIEIAKVKSVCDKVGSAIVEKDIYPELAAIFGDICEAIRTLSDTQSTIVSALHAALPSGKVPAKEQLKPVPPTRDQGAVNKKPRQELGAHGGDDDDITDYDYTIPEEVNSELKRFKDAVKDAEKSTLIFNLDMGKVPIMNPESIAKKATLALTSMAAVVEGKTHSIPSDDSVAAIDDVLSMSKGMKFYGNTTKTYRNPRDPKSGSYCTLPVRYDFKDKDTRLRAEGVLRSHCKVNCSTPYPVILRDCIKQVLNHVKTGYPDNYVRITVDPNSFALKVARRPPATELDPDPAWKVHDRLIPLPKEALNISARKVPEGFRMPSKDMPDSPSRRISRKEGHEQGGPCPTEPQL